MCDVEMPADYELLVARGPAMFGRSPPLAAADLLASLHLRCDTSPPPRSRARRPTPPPILVARPEDPPGSARLKKRVVFADDRGLSLTQVRVMTEPSHVPPTWSSQFLAQVTRGLTADAQPEPWQLTFPQPASDYVDFRRRLDTAGVSLENVIVREHEDSVVGTVKVRNLSFRKEVLVRCSADDWATHEDAHCSYVDGGAGAGGGSGVGYALYDTFSFRLTPPPRARRLQFCVCYRCDAGEFWDSNGGKNYALVKRAAPPPPPAAAAAAGEVLLKNLPRREAGEVSDATCAAVASWSEFASWHHLDTEGPYW
ncbi:protein phosphatase 1 regulatory subunit 3C [Bacillus rossius redtenbacheri]|uniref:protein phosphatase 1 regulatory subunit 3C n=1 Tax=Bacillus rossius redtenbacheri TaxID=93214 RepID=UPI002FDEE8E7